VAVEIAQGNAAVVERRWKVLDELEQPIEHRQGLRGPFEIQHAAALVVERQPMLRLDRQGALVADQCLGVPADFGEHPPLVRPYVGDLRIHLQRAIQKVQRFGGILALSLQNSEQVKAGDVVLMAAQQRLIEFLGGREASILVFGHGLFEQRAFVGSVGERRHASPYNSIRRPASALLASRTTYRDRVGATRRDRRTRFFSRRAIPATQPSRIQVLSAGGALFRRWRQGSG
jgi:hypothetical protein